MSRIDDLKKQHPSYALSAVDIFKMISPNQSNKYIEMLIKLHKQRTSESINANRHETGGIRPELIRVMTDWGLDYNYLETFDNESLYTFYENVEGWLGGSYIRLFSKFSALNERKLIENNDVTSYSDWKEIEQAVTLAEMKLIDKKLEKQIKKVYEDDVWLSLRPLSLEASMKYGANTKWCTTTESGQYYARYASRGILIYNINKKTGYKVACFKNIDPNHDNEFSWWDVTDRKIEALDSEAPIAVLEAIRNEIKEFPIPNKTLMTQEESDKLDLYRDGMKYRVEPMDESMLHITGGFDTTTSNHTLVFNPATYTTSTSNSIYTTSTSGVGIGTINPTTQLQVNGDVVVNNGSIRFRDNDGTERVRYTSSGIEFPDVTEPINEQIERRLFPELLEDDMRREAQQRLENAMAEQLAEANERVAEKHLSMLENLELGTLDESIIAKMQALAGIETREMRIRKTEAELERLRSEAKTEVPLEEVMQEMEAEQPVVPSKPRKNIWDAIKSIIK